MGLVYPHGYGTREPSTFLVYKLAPNRFVRACSTAHTPLFHTSAFVCLGQSFLTGASDRCIDLDPYCFSPFCRR